MTTSEAPPKDFIRQIVEEDLASGKHKSIVTRFPPEPSGYLHIGHAKAICINYGIASEYGGSYWLRMDDTNPLKEEDRYVQAIQEDIRWLGFDWQDRMSYASDYFPKLYEIAEQLISQGDAYVDSQSQDEIRAQRGTLTSPGEDSSWRARPAEESLEIFRAMKAGVFGDGEHVLRAKIDMHSPNINMRDPVLYRIRHIAHQRTGTDWCIYPMYDYTHCLCDAFEQITHSLCSMEFADHRPLYDWTLAAANTEHKPRQIEFSRLNLAYSITSKRTLSSLIERQHVDGWDDPRLPTLAALRRRGVSPSAIRSFSTRTGVTRKEHVIEMASFEHDIRDDLKDAPRVFAVLDPIRLIIDNWPADRTETLQAPGHPQDPEVPKRTLTFSNELWIERDDFAIEPPKGYKRLTEGADVRLRYGYIVRCGAPELDASGAVVAVHCTYYDNSRSGEDSSGIRTKGIIHWLSEADAAPARARLYEPLFNVSEPAAAEDIESVLRADSQCLMDKALVEPAALGYQPGETMQFERLGFFSRDLADADDGRAVFNRTIPLRDTWAEQGGKAGR